MTATRTQLVAVRVPQGEEIRAESAVSPAWQRYYELQRAAIVEAFGDANLMSADAATFRVNHAHLSSTTYQAVYLIVSPSPVPLAREIAGGGPITIARDDTAVFDELDPARILATCALSWQLDSNLHRAWLNAYVDQAYRRAGLGSAVVAFGREEVCAAGRTEIEAWTFAKPVANPDASAGSEDPGVLRPHVGSGAIDVSADVSLFALKCGFGLEMITRFSALENLTDPQVRNRLRARARELAASAASHYEQDYELRYVAGGFPDDMLADVAQMYTEFTADIPQGEGDEPTPFTAETVREDDARNEKRGLRIHRTIACERGSGRPVAYTTIYWRDTSAGPSQEDTWVSREHRGRRLGLAIKAENLLRVLAANDERLAAADVAGAHRPPATRIITWNADENAHMWAINEQLGFEIVGAEAVWRSFYYDGAWHPQRASAAREAAS